MYIFLLVILIIESGFLDCTFAKIYAWRLYNIMIGAVMFLVMYVWYRSRKIKNRYVNLCGWNITFQRYRS